MRLERDAHRCANHNLPLVRINQISHHPQAFLFVEFHNRDHAGDFGECRRVDGVGDVVGFLIFARI